MSDIEDLRRDLDAARADLLAALDGIEQEAFIRRPVEDVTDEEQRWPVRDVLWHVGLLEDWFRRAVDQVRGGREVDAYEVRRRPAHLNTPELLLAWLDQTRRPTLALLAKLDSAMLDGELTRPDGQVRTVRRLFASLAHHDRVHAEQVRALRALPLPEGQAAP